MNWIELNASFDQAPEDWSPIVDLLGRMGCPNTLQTDRPPGITACLVQVDGADARAEEIRRELLRAGANGVAVRLVPDEDWAEAYKKFFKPRRVGKRFLIRPTWETSSVEIGTPPPQPDISRAAPPRAEAGEGFQAICDSDLQSPISNLQSQILEIVLDPGQAFGTGDHPTTRMCLELMESIPIEGKRVADVGCGSGILSIGACKLGAKEVAGVDIEPLSVEVAKANAEQNGVAARFVAGDSISALGKGPWDVVLSNIISATLIAMTPEIATALNEDTPSQGGAGSPHSKSYWIVSGIIAANWPDVKKAAEGVGFIVERVLEEDGWVAATLKK